MSALRDVCKAHLEQKNCTLWGQAFNIRDEKGLERASDWLAQQVRDVLSFRQEQMEEGYGEATEQPQHGPLAGVR